MSDSRAARRAAVFVSCLLLLAGDVAAETWDPIRPDELAATRSPIDSSAGAEALFWKVWIDDELEAVDVRSVWRHYLRVKIYTAESAQQFARREIRFPSTARITEVLARTIQPDGKITVMDNRSLSRETVVRVKGGQLKSITFAPPNVRPGCIVEYRYREVYDEMLMNYSECDLQLDNLPARRIQYHMRPLVIPGWAQRQMTFNTSLTASRPEGGYYIAARENAPAFRSERLMPPERHLKSWMMLYYTDQKLEAPARFWTDRGKELAEEFDEWCKADQDLRKAATSAAAGASDERDRLRRIAEWCRREVRCVSSPDPDTLRAHKIKANTSARTTLKQRAGTRADFDRLFGALARAAGFEVRFARVPSRSDVLFSQDMIDLRFLPSYQIVVKANGGWRSFDPQARWLPWDMVPWNEEGQLSLVCDRDSTMFLETPIAEPARSIRFRAGELSLDENGDLSGDVRIRLTGHWNDNAREAFESDLDSLAVLREIMHWEGAAIELARLRLQPVHDDHEEFAATVHVRLPGHAAVAGERLLLEPSAWWSSRPAVFSEARRKWPVHFPFAWSDVDSLRIRLPQGWKVESVPSPRPVNAVGVAAYAMTLAAADGGRTLDCQRMFDMGLEGTLYFPVSAYGELRRLFESLLDRDHTAVPLVREASAR